MSKKLLFKGGHATGMIPFEIEDFSTLYMRDARVDEKTKAYIDSVIGNSVLNLCPYRNVLVTHKYDTVEGNVITLDDCQDNEVIQLSEIQGNTMVNCCKDGSKELTLNGDIDTSGYNNVTLTEGVDGGKVDVSLEGNTMVNVCDQEDPIAITKSYEVTTGNHVALQGEYDGKCRPNVYGNTIVSWQDSKDINKGQQVTINKQYETKSIHTLHTTVGDKIYFRIKFTVDEMNTTSAEPKVFTGYSMGYKIDVKHFKDCTVGKIEEASTIREHESARTDQTHMDLCIGMYAPMPDDVPAGSAVCKYTMHDYVIYNLTQLFGAGKEPQQEWCDKNLPYLEGMQSSFEDKLITDEKDAHSGKYKVDYKVTGKNLFNVADMSLDSKGNVGITPTIKDGKIILNGTSTSTYDFRPIASVWNDKLIKYVNNLPAGTTLTMSNNLNLPNYWSVKRNGTIVYTTNSVTIQSGDESINNFVRVEKGTTLNNMELKIQIEEGTKATTYEPYKKYTKTLYLNSPLLKGDTIEQSGNDIVHMHRYSKVVLDGSNYNISRNGTKDSTKYRWTLYKNDDILKNTNNANILINDRYPLSTPNGTWGNDNNYIEGITINSQDPSIFLYLDKYKDGSDTSKQALIKELSVNPVTLIYKLATPIREVISTNDNLLLDSYVNGHLDVDSVVPIDKVMFKGNFNTSLKYLYPNTEYTIQLESNNIGKIDRLHIGGVNNDTLDVIKGINKYTITTGELSSKSIIINGIGFNASKIVITPKVDGEFGYFKGMKSVGQDDENGHKIEILSSNSDNTLSNKKEILMNEPLRGLPNGVRDKYVMIDGKWYIERNTIQLIMDSTFIQDKTLHHYVSTNYPDVIGFSTPNNWFKWGSSLVCDNLVYDGHRNINAGSLISNQEKIFVYDYIFITLNKNKVSTLNEAGFREYLKNNPITLVGQNTAPTYEPIDYNPFEVYSDTTHISNNSTIPCNMKIQNTGYNAIIKPSTLYTVALDTNKSGTIGMNLGGTKVTTTNNVATITTPATLTDNTLRLYGKGIKASGVRLLEGDKTNWIPSHFEGMKSCFEDKLQDDGKYKMEILMNNKNLFNSEIFKDLSKFKVCLGTPDWRYYPIYVGKSKKVYLKRNYKDGITEYPKVLVSSYKDYGMNIGGWLPIIHPGYREKYYEGYILSDDLGFVYIQTPLTDYKKIMNTIENCIICTEDISYEPCIYNKIQFLLNEPLRGLPNGVKDKVYVKEDKVVVQRNIGAKRLTSEDVTDYIGTMSTSNTKPNVKIIQFKLHNLKPSLGGLTTLCNKLKTGKIGIDDETSIEHLYWGTEYNWIGCNNLKESSVGMTIDKTLLSSDSIEGARQYIDNENIELVYQLETPVYEEVECDLSKLALEGYDHGTLFYGANMPVTTQFYEFNVNIKDMLIPNETYYVTFNADRVKDITINLSGVQVNYKTSMGYNKVPIQLGDVVNTNFSMDSRGVELSDLMISTSTSLIYVKDMNDVCVYDEATNKYSITITSTNGKESDKRVILLDYPLLRLNKDIYDRLYYSNKDSRYRIDKKVFKHKFTNNHEYSKYAAETNDTYYSSFISLNEAIKDYVVITNEKVKTVKVEDDKYYFKIKWSDLGVSDKTEANGNQGVKDFFNNNEVYLYYATDGFVEIVDGLRRQTLKVYQPETTMKFLGNTTTTVTILIPMKNV